jgi:tetratricopeptide (TPR) repeat protein
VFDYASGISLPRDAYLPPEQNAPLLAAAGWSIRFSKPDKAAELIKKALAIEAEHPSAFRGQTDFAFDWLIQRAFAQKDFKQMVQLLREQAERAPWSTGELPDPVAQLFAAHADHGPLPGLAGDLRSYQEYLGHPELIYTLARMLERRDHRIGAAMVNALAMIMGGPTGESHYMTGVFLAERGWSAAAERELLCSLTLSNGRLYESYVELSALAEQRDDDLSAAQYLERGLQQLRDSGQIRQSLLAEQIESQIQLHYVRAFRQAHDLNALKTHLEKFMQFNQTAQMLDRDPEQAADIVPALQDVGRNAEADEIFDAAYAAIRGKVNTAPTDPMPKNNLAWLCACSGKKLDEAVKYSNEAVALDPEDAACLDTQAEAFMRTGNAQRAVEIETHALQIKPEDVYMKKQLERFRAAAAKK